MADTYNNDNTLREVVRSFLQTKLTAAGVVPDVIYDNFNTGVDGWIGDFGSILTLNQSSVTVKNTSSSVGGMSKVLDELIDDSTYRVQTRFKADTALFDLRIQLGDSFYRVDLPTIGVWYEIDELLQYGLGQTKKVIIKGQASDGSDPIFEVDYVYVSTEKNEGIVFELGKDFKQVNASLTHFKQLDGTYKKVEQSFTVAMIEDFLGSPEPLKNYRLFTYTLPMIFLGSTKVNYDEIKESLERFSRSLIGEEFIESGYFFGTNCDDITNTEEVVNINGVEYVKYATTVYITTSVTALIGNFIKSYLGDITDGVFDATKLIRIYPTERVGSRAFIPEETQKNNEQESTTIYKESTWQGDLSFIIDNRTPLFKSLIIELEEPTDLNKGYSRRIDYNIDAATIFDKVVGFQGITLDANIGTYALMSVIMKKSGM